MNQAAGQINWQKDGGDGAFERTPSGDRNGIVQRWMDGAKPWQNRAAGLGRVAVLLAAPWLACVAMAQEAVPDSGPGNGLIDEASGESSQAVPDGSGPSASQESSPEPNAQTSMSHVSEEAPATLLPRFRRRIDEKTRDVGAPPVLLVALGDSVTQGATKLGMLEPQSVYHNRLKCLLEERFSECTFSVINAGVGGQAAMDAVSRLDRDVISHHPDLVIVGFGLNDCAGGDAGLDSFRDALREIIQQVRQRTEAELVLLTPNFMCEADSGRIHPSHRQAGLLEAFRLRQNSGILGRYAQTIRELADSEGVVLADVYAAWSRLSEADVDTDGLLANGLNHPTAEAHRIPAELLMKLIDPSFDVRALRDFADPSSSQ